MKKHLAIFDKHTAEAILSGKKTIETRFSKHKIPPFGVIEPGDLVYLKVSGGEIIGQFKVKKVYSYQGINLTDVKKIRDEFAAFIDTGSEKDDENYWLDKYQSRFGSLIFIEQSERFITSPIKIKKSDQRGWLVL